MSVKATIPGRAALGRPTAVGPLGATGRVATNTISRSTLNPAAVGVGSSATAGVARGLGGFGVKDLFTVLGATAEVFGAISPGACKAIEQGKEPSAAEKQACAELRAKAQSNQKITEDDQRALAVCDAMDNDPEAAKELCLAAGKSSKDLAAVFNRLAGEGRLKAPGGGAPPSAGKGDVAGSGGKILGIPKPAFWIGAGVLSLGFVGVLAVMLRQPPPRGTAGLRGIRSRRRSHRRYR